ncbi:6999_t:CDS:2, partial [Cetraspora pellucida]
MNIFLNETIIHFIGPVVEIYFAKLIIDYAIMVTIERNNSPTPGRVENPDIPSNQES